jgi:hypothetical protein
MQAGSLPAGVKFWETVDELPDAPDPASELPPALERLGPSPFPRSGFPFLGFLATVYDHVASHVGAAADRG